MFTSLFSSIGALQVDDRAAKRAATSKNSLAVFAAMPIGGIEDDVV